MYALFIFLVVFFFLYIIYELSKYTVYVSSREEYSSTDSKYRLGVEKFHRESLLPFSLDDIRFIVGKKVGDEWVYKNAYQIPFIESIHRSKEYNITWIDGGAKIKISGERKKDVIYRIYFEDYFETTE